MIARSTLYTVSGGDTVQIVQTAKELSNIGVSVDIKLANETIQYSNYDLLHFFNIIRPADILYHLKRCQKPLLVSPIMINYSEFDRYYRRGFAGILFRFLTPGAIEYAKALSRWVLGRDTLRGTSYLLMGYHRAIKTILKKTSLLLPNSQSEYNRIKNQYNCAGKYVLAPNGIDPELFKFDDTIKKDTRLIICVARIEGIKNQYNLIKAINNTNYHLLIIGAPAQNQLSYFKSCKKIAAGNIFFIEHLPQPELLKYYQQAKVHVLPSWFETTGLSSLEAAAMGCNIVITAKGDAKGASQVSIRNQAASLTGRGGRAK